MSEQQNPVAGLDDSDLSTDELEEVAGGAEESIPVTDPSISLEEREPNT
jgi:hypothetical protein